MTDEQSTALESGLETLGLDPAGAGAGLLERYIAELELWNPRYGLVAPGEDLVRRHILDSLSGLGEIRKLEPRRLADIGSGAGFPGIPLAIFLPGTRIHLVERMGRRAGFLRNVILALGLKDTVVLEKPVEQVSADEAGFDLVTFRAWSAIDGKVLDAMKSILSPEGKVAAYKGRKDVIEAELRPAAERIRNLRILPLEDFGGGEERNLVIFGM